MYSTHFRPAPSLLQRLIASFKPSEILRACSLSALVTVAMLLAFSLGEPSPSHAVAVATPPAVAQRVDVVAATPSAWSADDSASGTLPDRAH